MRNAYIHGFFWSLFYPQDRILDDAVNLNSNSLSWPLQFASSHQTIYSNSNGTCNILHSQVARWSNICDFRTTCRRATRITSLFHMFLWTSKAGHHFRSKVLTISCFLITIYETFIHFHYHSISVSYRDAARNYLVLRFFIFPSIPKIFQKILFLWESIHRIFLSRYTSYCSHLQTLFPGTLNQICYLAKWWPTQTVPNSVATACLSCRPEIFLLLYLLRNLLSWPSTISIRISNVPFLYYDRTGLLVFIHVITGTPLHFSYPSSYSSKLNANWFAN